MTKLRFHTDTTFDLSAINQHILKYWSDNQIFEKSISERPADKPFIFYEGPPSANGTPGIHHVMARAVKDLFCRYKTMQGYRVERKAGWDTHGLPVELQVEKELGIKKEDIGIKISVEEYNEKCRQAVLRFTDQWNEMTRQMGYWVDMEHPYVTYEPEYIESLWFLLSELYKKGYLYKGYTIQPYSPAAGTGLSSHELNQPGTYRDVKDTSIVAQFKAIDSTQLGFNAGDEVFFLAWTTTPWTLPANSALALGEKIEYVAVESFNQYTHKKGIFILALALVGKYFPESAEVTELPQAAEGKTMPWRRLKTFKGVELAGITYEQLLPYIQPDGKAFQTILGDFVSTEDGTGIVHISPTFGADDYRVAQQAGIAPIMSKDETGKPVPIVDRTGKFTAEMGEFAGMYVKNYTGADETAADYRSTDVLISIKLKAENKAFRVEKYEHSYPHCWRTDKPVLYYPLDSWFIKTTAAKDRLIELNKTINWKPESTGTGRFGNWLENLVDWNLSRSRYWGTPLPVWRSEDASITECVGSIQELVNHLHSTAKSGVLSDEELAANQKFLDANAAGKTDLHKPFVDPLTLVVNGTKLRREADLIDVWFDSGAMPYAQWQYLGDKSVLENRFPADFIAEGVDQTRGWFFTLHALAVLLFDSVAFKNVVSNGLVLDKNGNKMSKRLGNAVDPFATIEKYGADATRWYMISNSAPWDNLKFNADGVEETRRKFFGTLHNTYQFFALYANLEELTAEQLKVDAASLDNPLDKWLLHRLNQLIAESTRQLDAYEPTEAARAIQQFVDEDLSNWYVRLNRRRFWKTEHDSDKQTAFAVLHTALETISRLIAPIAPFYADYLYQNLTGTTNSVHLQPYPVATGQAEDDVLDTHMELVRQVTSLIHGIRKKHKIKTRRPLKQFLVPSTNAALLDAVHALGFIVQSETNVKEVNILEPGNSLIVKSAKLNFKRLGKSLGPKIQEVSKQVLALTSAEIDAFEESGYLELIICGESVRLEGEDLEIHTADIPGWIIAREGSLTVALDLEQTDELLQEGFAREFVNRVQNLRKDQGLDVQDKIGIRINLTDRQHQPFVESALATHREYIMQEVQALNFDFAPDLNGSAQQIEVEEQVLSIAIDKLPA